MKGKRRRRVKSWRKEGPGSVKNLKEVCVRYRAAIALELKWLLDPVGDSPGPVFYDFPASK